MRNPLALLAVASLVALACGDGPDTPEPVAKGAAGQAGAASGGSGGGAGSAGAGMFVGGTAGGPNLPQCHPTVAKGGDCTTVPQGTVCLVAGFADKRLCCTAKDRVWSDEC